MKRYDRLLCALALLCLLLSLAPAAHAQEAYRWSINHQYVDLDVRKDGNVDMLYEVDANIVKGVWNEIWIPITTNNPGDQQVHYVEDGSGKRHDFYVDGQNIKVQGFNLKPGDNVRLVISSTLHPFVYKSSNKEGYANIDFNPPWWDMVIQDTKISVYLPADIPKNEVFTGKTEWSNFQVIDGKTKVYFENSLLGQNEIYKVTVAFPDKYMNSGAIAAQPGPFEDIPGLFTGLLDSTCGCWIPLLIFIGMIFIIALGGMSGRKSYGSPVVSMDGIGINKSLDPVEAATLLRVDPGRVLTMIMFSLMKNGNIKLISTEPIKVQPISRQGLNYYEKLFMDSVKDDTPDEDKLLECFKVLARRVVDKTRPYCRKDTEDYYKDKITQSWKEISALETPELRLQKYDTDMIWLMADERFTTKTKDYIGGSPGSDTYTIPPYYWWYPYYVGLPHHYGGTPGTPAPAPKDMGRPGGGVADRTVGSVETFANSISNSVEKFSAGIVGGVEKFVGVRNEANAPPPVTRAPSASGRPASCACVSCACACVSCACACACAGGGGGCT